MRSTIPLSSKVKGLVAALGVALTLPAVIPGPGEALAAPTSEWDQLAQCESGGDWGANTGNGYYGGIQFNADTWKAYGGDKYGETADKASREEQISIAEKVLDKQGWGAWPSCSQEKGLSGKAEPNKKPEDVDGKTDNRGGNGEDPVKKKDKGEEEKGEELKPDPIYGEAHMQKSTIRIGRMVAKRWKGKLDTIGGWRPSDPYPDHPSGRAADIMIPNYDTPEGKKIGDEISQFLAKHKDELNIMYMIWRQRYWDGGAWSLMEDRGDPTQNHFDHVHVTTNENERNGQPSGGEKYYDIGGPSNKSDTKKTETKKTDGKKDVKKTEVPKKKKYEGPLDPEDFPAYCREFMGKSEMSAPDISPTKEPSDPSETASPESQRSLQEGSKTRPTDERSLEEYNAEVRKRKEVCMKIEEQIRWAKGTNGTTGGEK